MSQSTPTEAILEAARDLDQRGVEEILALIHAEDRRALAAVGRVLPDVARGVDVLAGVLRDGGRWINAGAGTSGRMGALDAAELPPTFGIEPDRVRAVIAGGPEALVRAREGAEDDAAAAERDLAACGLSACDALLAISASGRTAYTLGALETARARGARVLALTCDPDSPLARAAEIVIAPVVGPEVIAGSTRMKGGLAQKLVLHLLSTAVMVKLGRVRGNLMANMRPASSKLRQRAVAILVTLAGVDEERARALLEAAGGDLAAALAQVRPSA